MPAIQRQPQALFRDRHAAGEALCFGALSRAELVEPVVIAVSHGGVEVGFPYAWLEGGTLHLLPTGEGEGAFVPPPGQVRDRRLGAHGLRPGAPRLDGVAGRDVVLLDDGLAPVTALVDTAQAIRRGGPRRFVLAVPFITPPVRRLFVPRLVDGVVTARQAHRVAPGTALYADPAPTPPDRARSMILDVLGADGRRAPDLALTDGPGEARGALPPSGALPRSEALPPSEALPRSETLARVEALSRSETLPPSEALPRGEGLPRREALARVEALARSEGVPSWKTSAAATTPGPRALRARHGVLPSLPARERDWAAVAWLRIPHHDPLRLSGEES